MAVGRGSFNHFPRFSRLIRERAEDLRHENSMLLAQYMADEAPVRTGELAGSFEVHHEGDKTDVVESTAEHAVPVARGHHTRSGSWVPANPFDERALARLRRKQAKDKLL